MARAKTKSLAEKARTPKNLEIADRARKAALGAGEPVIDPERYEATLGAAFTYYNTYGDEKTRRKWIQKYVGKDKEALTKLSKVSDHDLRQVAILIRLSEREQFLKDDHIAMINDRLIKFFDDVSRKKESLPEEDNKKPAVSVQDRIQALASERIGEIEGEIDKFSVEKESNFSMKDYIAANSISSPVAKIIGDFFTKRKKELEELQKVWADKKRDDFQEQLMEAYSHFTRPQARKFLALFDSIVQACMQVKVTVATRARKPRVKPPAEVVKRVKYMPEFSELKLKSEHPTKLVGANEVWLYSTKYKRVTCLKAADNDLLMVKGTTLLNFDVGKSNMRGLRKPEEFFKTSLTKRELANAFKGLKTKVYPAKGRINEETIILAVFH